METAQQEVFSTSSVLFVLMHKHKRLLALELNPNLLALVFLVSAGLAAIHGLYESNDDDGPISASSLDDDQISHLLLNTDGSTAYQRSSSQSTLESRHSK